MSIEPCRGCSNKKYRGHTYTYELMFQLKNEVRVCAISLINLWVQNGRPKLDLAGAKFAVVQKKLESGNNSQVTNYRPNPIVVWLNESNDRFEYFCDGKFKYCQWGGRQMLKDFRNKIRDKNK